MRDAGYAIRDTGYAMGAVRWLAPVSPISHLASRIAHLASGGTPMPRSIRIAVAVSAALALTLLALTVTRAHEEEEGSKVKCANLIYAGTKSSVCFSDRFLKRLQLETNIRTEPAFV